MNAAAMLKHKIITVEEFSLLQQVDKSAGLRASNVPRYWGRQVTKGRFINPKFEKLYKTEITDAGNVSRVFQDFAEAPITFFPTSIACLFGPPGPLARPSHRSRFSLRLLAQLKTALSIY